MRVLFWDPRSETVQINPKMRRAGGRVKGLFHPTAVTTDVPASSSPPPTSRHFSEHIEPCWPSTTSNQNSFYLLWCRCIMGSERVCWWLNEDWSHFWRVYRVVLLSSLFFVKRILKCGSWTKVCSHSLKCLTRTVLTCICPKFPLKAEMSVRDLRRKTVFADL